MCIYELGSVWSVRIVTTRPGPVSRAAQSGTKPLDTGVTILIGEEIGENTQFLYYGHQETWGGLQSILCGCRHLLQLQLLSPGSGHQMSDITNVPGHHDQDTRSRVTVPNNHPPPKRWSSACEYSIPMPETRPRTRTPGVPTYTDALIRN